MDSSKRHFFSNLLKQGIVLVDEVRGKKQVPLESFSQLPDEQLKDLVPVYFPESDYQISKKYLQKWNSVAFEFVNERPWVWMEHEIITLFDGQTSLSEVAAQLSQTHEISQPLVFETVKRIFLEMVEKKICHPAVANEE
ncbi:MAG: hypothetical protein ABIJ59_20035 [Pseudomonadota bacterium]